MIISQASKYGIRAMLCLAANEDFGNVPIRRLAGDLHISPAFLTKIFQSLSQAGLVISVRGLKGGVMLCRPAGTITLRQVYEAIDGPSLFSECLLGLPDCGSTQPCPVHEKWILVRESLTELFESTTLDEMAEDIQQKRYRLKHIIA